jgi:hypothetical protein
MGLVRYRNECIQLYCEGVSVARQGRGSLTGPPRAVRLIVRQPNPSRRDVPARVIFRCSPLWPTEPFGSSANPARGDHPHPDAVAIPVRSGDGPSVWRASAEAVQAHSPGQTCVVDAFLPSSHCPCHAWHTSTPGPVSGSPHGYTPTGRSPPVTPPTHRPRRDHQPRQTLPSSAVGRVPPHPRDTCDAVGLPWKLGWRESRSRQRITQHRASRSPSAPASASAGTHGPRPPSELGMLRDRRADTALNALLASWILARPARRRPVPTADQH